MPESLKTLNLVQDLGPRRFATLSIGATGVTTIREEFALLRRVAALACGVLAPEALTREDLETLLGRVATWRAQLAADPTSHAEVRALLEIGPREFVALLLALVSEAAA